MGGSASPDDLVIRTDGKIGIGNVAPSWLLHVQGSSGTSTIGLKNTGGHSTVYVEASSGNTAKLNLFQSGTSGYSLQTGGTDALQIFRDSTYFAQFDNGGRFLIGTTTTTGAAKLQLLQTGGDALLVRNHDTNYEGIILSNASGEARLMATSGGSTARPALTFFTGDAERMRITSGGDITVTGGSTVFKGTGDTWADSSGGIKITGNTPGSRGNISMYYDTNILELGAGITQKNRIEIHGHSGDNAIKFFTNGGEKLELQGDGDLKLQDGDVILNTSGHGVLFHSHASANRLDDYEEGSWTPTPDDLSNTPQYYNRTGTYTKIGNLVYAIGFLQFGSSPQPQFNSTSSSLTISGLPFPCDAGTGYVGAVGGVTYQSMNWSGGTYNDYGATNDVMAGPNNQSKTTFRVNGTNDTIRGTLRRAAWHNSSCIITWSFVYRTNS